VDRRVVEAVMSKDVEVGGHDLARHQRQFDREIEHRAIPIGETRPRVVGHHVLNQLLAVGMILDLDPEVLRVGSRSVVAAVGPRDRGGDHLALDSAQTASS